MLPHKFVNKDNLNYVGELPNIKIFNNISEKQCEQYKYRFDINNWSIKNEAIKYCELDCKALYEIIMIFGENFFMNFKN